MIRPEERTMLDTPQPPDRGAIEDQDIRAARDRLAVARALVAEDKPEVGGFFEALVRPPASPTDILRANPKALATLARMSSAVAASHRPAPAWCG